MGVGAVVVRRWLMVKSRALCSSNWKSAHPCFDVQQDLHYLKYFFSRNRFDSIRPMESLESKRRMI
jgi:hypothetical protein